MEINFFYPIPGYDNYHISESGKVYNSKTKNVLSGSINPAEYVNYRIKNNDGDFKTEGRHRLLCIVFKPTSLDLRDLVVNHINGVKGDDRLENLEWTSYVGNLEHAGKLWLTTKCLPVSVLDVDTGEIEEFPSAVKVSRKLGLSKDAVLYRLKFHPHKVFPERKQYRVGHGHINWIPNTDVEGSIREYTNKRPILTKNIVTGEIEEFLCMASFSHHVGMSGSWVTEKLQKEEQPFFPPNLIFKLDDGDRDNWRTIVVGDEIDKSLNTCAVMIVSSDSEKFFSTVRECSDYVNVNYTTVLYRLSRKNKNIFDGWKYYYYKEYKQLGSPQMETTEVL